MTAAEGIRDLIANCDRALKSARTRVFIVGASVKPVIQAEILRAEIRRDALTECLMLVERE